MKTPMKIYKYENIGGVAGSVQGGSAIGLMNFYNTATVELLMAHNLLFLSSYIITS